MTPTEIQAVSPGPSSPAGGTQAITPKTRSGSADPSSQLFRRPRRTVVRSLRFPTRGSLTASHTRATRKIVPTTAVDAPRLSAAYLRYISRKSM